jgi:hypothetical protein
MGDGSAVIKGDIKWHRTTETRVLKSGYAYTGPAGSVAMLEGVMADVIPAGVYQGMVWLAADMRKYARSRHPWTNRTGEAEKSLVTYAERVIGGSQAVLTYDKERAHYVFWLETRWNGRYAIIGPTIQLFAPKAGKIIEGAVRLAVKGKGSVFRDTKTGRFV